MTKNWRGRSRGSADAKAHANLSTVRADLAGLGLALVWTAGLFVVPGPSFAQEDQQLQAYVALVLAEEARDEEAWRRAYTTYEQALEHYRTLADQHPKWQPDIVHYRIGYCTEQMAALRLHLPKPAVPEPSPSVSEEAGAPVERADLLAGKIHALTGENEYLRRRVQQLNDELDRVPPAVVPAGDPGEQAAFQRALEEAEARADQVEDEYASHRAEAGAAASKAQAALTALRLEKGETDQVNHDLIRQLEAAADEHSRLSALLAEDGGSVSPYTLREPNDRPTPDADDDLDEAEVDEEDTVNDLMDAVPP